MPPRVWVLCAIFVIRGTFYAAMMPDWEGWDEYAHFAWLQHWNAQHALPVMTDRLSREVDEALRLAPLPRELAWIGPPYLTHEQWWALPAAERASLQQALRAIPPAHAEEVSSNPLILYEAQQPPLYYWLASPVLLASGSRPVGERVFLVRLFGVLLAMLAIPLTWLAASCVLEPWHAFCCAALLSIAPGFVIDTARVGNDSLAVALTALFVWLLMRRNTHWALLGIACGAAMLTKAHLLVLLPVMGCVLARDPKRFLKSGLAACAIGAWWYARNLSQGIGLTGWQEQVSLEKLAAGAGELNWMAGGGTVLKSFIWFGGWSFLTLKSWMYTTVEATAFCGLVLMCRSGLRKMRVPLTLLIGFAIATAIGEAMYFAVHGMAGIPGWYLWPAGGALAIAITAGLRRRTPVLAALLAFIDIYGVMAKMMPYYAGLAPFNRGSAAQFPEALARLHVQPILVAGWLAVTCGMPVWLIFTSRQKLTTDCNKIRFGVT